MLDSYGRDINYLRISVTDLCNLKCRYCTPLNGCEKKEQKEILSLSEIKDITEAFVSLGTQKVRITGGEPLIREGIINIIESIGKMDKVKDFAMTTNGILLEKYAKDLKSVGLNRVNISLDTLDDKKYNHITRGGSLKEVLKGIEAAKKVGISPIKLNVVLIKDFNEDEINSFVSLTKYEDIDVRFIELMPIGQTYKWSLEKYKSNSIVLEKNKDLIKIESTDISSPATYYKLPGGKGRVGLINPISCKFCDKCNRIRLTADGKVKSCLHSNEEINLINRYRNGEDIKKIIYDLIMSKPKEHGLENGDFISRNMMAIGG
ncbi:GTP 3',8-cyclase MoaA [Clostridium lacusfryxellense]|uniref:GTP 3',8-cyclase MoaA n=1 Tax=Clostridium lacusfryxellense TaxID=205328 RepID=UPI001C0AC228|nr:GTP 3',8-cyclase MoaA [Clostridium lacusfryxellense]MBU3109966.1 GTP 3',8-cyclase MoaA [Clostridium lacusfryxellense]